MYGDKLKSFRQKVLSLYVPQISKKDFRFSKLEIHIEIMMWVLTSGEMEEAFSSS